MPFTIKLPIPLYAGVTNLALRITEPGSSARVNGVADDALADTSSDGLFSTTVAENLIGTYQYVVYRAGTPVQMGWLHRDEDQASVLADDERVDLSADQNSGRYAIAVEVLDDDENPVRAASVWIRGSSTVKTTDQFGRATLYAGPGEYEVLCEPPLGYADVEAQDITITNEDVPCEFVAAKLISSSPTRPDGCMVTLPVDDQYGESHAGVSVTIQFTGFAAGATKSAVIFNRRVTETSDANGRVEVELMKLAKYTASYRLADQKTRTVEFTTPNAVNYTVVEP